MAQEAGVITGSVVKLQPTSPVMRVPTVDLPIDEVAIGNGPIAAVALRVSVIARIVHRAVVHQPGPARLLLRGAASLHGQLRPRGSSE